MIRIIGILLKWICGPSTASLPEAGKTSAVTVPVALGGGGGGTAWLNRYKLKWDVYITAGKVVGNIHG